MTEREKERTRNRTKEQGGGKR
jgi:hypothetical protein